MEFFSTSKMVFSAALLVGLNSLPYLTPRLYYMYYKSPIETPHELEQHVKKMAAIIGLPHPENLHVFVNSTMTSMSFGSTYLPGGGWISLPRQVIWKNVDDVRYSSLVLNNKPVEWDSDYGTRLASCLLQSASQINFRIGHEICHIQNHHSLFHVIFSPFILFSLYLYFNFFSQMIQRFGKAYNSGVLISLLIAGVSYLSGTKYSNHHFEYKADEFSANLGIGFAKGGLEMLQKHREVAVLMGTDEDEETITHPSCKDRIRHLQDYIRDNYTQLVTQDTLLTEAFRNFNINNK